MTNQSSEVPWTPGPWRESYCGADTSEIIASDGLVVAAVWHRGSSSLIAEAPTMAALLERLLDLAEYAAAEFPSSIEDCREARALLSRIRSVK